VLLIGQTALQCSHTSEWVPFVVLAVLKIGRLDEIIYYVRTRRDVNSRETEACLRRSQKFSRTLEFGTSTFMDLTLKGLWPVVNASTLIAYGMTSRPILPSLMRLRETSLRQRTPSRVGWGLGSPSSPPSQDAKDNKIFEQVELTMPVLAVGGEKSFGPLQAVIMRHVATNVQEAVVAGSGHWLMEERPAETVALIRNFLDSP